jgi:hypothetical protein
MFDPVKPFPNLPAVDMGVLALHQRAGDRGRLHGVTVAGQSCGTASRFHKPFSFSNRAKGDARIDFWPSPRAGGEWAKPGPIEVEGDRPACTRAKRREGRGYRLDRQAERLRGDGLALAQRGDAPHTR